jgi:hypothetical protein
MWLDFHTWLFLSLNLCIHKVISIGAEHLFMNDSDIIIIFSIVSWSLRVEDFRISFYILFVGCIYIFMRASPFSMICLFIFILSLICICIFFLNWKVVCCLECIIIFFSCLIFISNQPFLFQCSLYFTFHLSLISSLLYIHTSLIYCIHLFLFFISICFYFNWLSLVFIYTGWCSKPN